MATKNELELAIEEIYEASNDCEGSRSAMQDCLDRITDVCLEVSPELDEADGDESNDGDGDGADDGADGDDDSG